MSLKGLLSAMIVGSMTWIIGCGGGGGGSQSTAPPPSSAGTGSIVITLHAGPQASAAEPVKGGITEAASLPTPTSIRFVVRNATTGFKSIQDVAVAGTQTVDIPVPVADGYTLDAISSKIINSEHNMLKWAQATGINVTKGNTTNVSMTLDPIVPTITPPTTVGEGDAFDVSITIPSALKSYYAIHTRTAPITDAAPDFATDYTQGTPTKASMTALTARDSNGNAIAGREYFQGRFYLGEGLSTGDVEWASWVLYYPNYSFGDTAISCALTVPSGGIGVDVTY